MGFYRDLERMGVLPTSEAVETSHVLYQEDVIGSLLTFKNIESPCVISESCEVAVSSE